MTVTIYDTKTTRAERTLAGKRRPLWLAVCQLVVSSCAVLALLEAIFWLSGTGEQEYLAPNPVTGYSPMPGKHVTWRQEGFSSATFNRFGMPDVNRTINNFSGSLRLAVLGDSYVEALQVARDASFCRLIEKKLGNGSQPVEVMNFAVSGYNIGQMYLRLKDLALDFKPSIVILAMRMDQPPQLDPNPEGGFIFARPTFELDKQGKLIQDRSVQEKWYAGPDGKRMIATNWLRRNSRVWGVISLAAQQLNKNKGKRHHLLQERPVAEQWPVAQAILAAAKNLCLNKGAKLVLVALPGPGTAHNSEQLSLMKHSAQLLGIPFLNLEPQFSQAAQRGEKLYFESHMNEQGHRLVSDLVINFLRKQAIATN
jgi:hypothetical protein